MTALRKALRALHEESGFTMIIAIGVMFVTGLILVAAFTIANGDVHNSRRDINSKQAYYAAIAGIQQYENELQIEPNFWQKCETVENKLKKYEEETEHLKEPIKYAVTPLPANEAAACSTSSPFSTMIESKGKYANTFRVRSVGTGPGESTKAGAPTRSVIATFAVSGFLDYLFYTNFETEDPGLYSSSSSSLAAKCANKHYSTWHAEGLSCHTIEWNGDVIEGPFHTEDAADVTGQSTFGRAGHEPVDPVEMRGGTYGSSSGCSGSTYNDTEKCPETGVPLPLPSEDTSLKFYLEPSGTYEGETWLTLEGSTMTVKKYKPKSTELETKTGVAMPSNGLIYVKNTEGGSGCSVNFEVENSDTSTEQTEAKECGTVFVSGYYEKSLTIASEQDVIVNGNVYPKGLTLGKEPGGANVLGLIANEYVRVYHPCSGGTNTSKWENPWIYAAILATKHSWIVDNAGCGSLQGKLNIYGALAQNYRGVVYRNGHGYEKHYVYDERLATDEPPYFLAPLKAGWKVIRQVAQKPG